MFQGLEMYGAMMVFILSAAILLASGQSALGIIRSKSKRKANEEMSRQAAATWEDARQRTLAVIERSKAIAREYGPDEQRAS